MADSDTEDFLTQNVKEGEIVTKAVAALKAILINDSFEMHAVRITALLQEPTTGLGPAKHANTSWLTKVFSSRQQARLQLGQPLAPADTIFVKPSSREVLVKKITPLMTETPNGKISLILGKEGKRYVSRLIMQSLQIG